MIRALIFDFDGLIVDSETPGYQAWSEIYASHGCSLSLETYSACIGTVHGFDLHGDLERLTRRDLDRARLEAECTRRWRELMKDQPLLPGVEACLAAAKARNLKLAVASSSTRTWVEENLARFGLADHFDVICTREDVHAVKPDPALYIGALDRLGVTARQAVAFEDSPNGILAAKRAGIFCIVVPNALTEQLPLELADRRLSSLQEFNFENV